MLCSPWAAWLSACRGGPVSPAYSLIAQDFEKLKYVLDLLSPGSVFAALGEAYLKAVQAVVPRDVELVVRERFPCDRPLTLFAALAGTEVTPQVDTADDGVGPDSIAKFLLTSGSTRRRKQSSTRTGCCGPACKCCDSAGRFWRKSRRCLWIGRRRQNTFGGNQNVGLVLYNGGSLYIDEGKPTPKLMGKTLANLREISPTIHFNVPERLE